MPGFLRRLRNAGAVDANLERKFVCVDENQPAIDVMAKRLAAHATFTAFPAG